MSLIETQEELDIFCKAIRNESVLAIDTEFVRHHTYYPKLCLIQFGTIDQCFIIDILQNLDFSELKKLLENNDIVKIIHSSKQDIVAINKFFGIKISNIFDTQIAATICGYGDVPSYSYICQKILGATISKDEQYSNWEFRPLTDQKIQYALNDVRYLVRLYEILNGKAKTLGRVEWIWEDCNNLYTNYKAEYNWVKFTNNPRSEKELLNIKSLCKWREIKAEEMNIAPNVLIKNDILYQIAVDNKLPEDFTKYAHLTNEINEILETEANNFIINEFDAIKKVNSNNELKGLIKQILNYIGDKYNLPTSFIASRDDIFIFLLSGYTRFNEGWRKEIFGKIVEML